MIGGEGSRMEGGGIDSQGRTGPRALPVLAKKVQCDRGRRLMHVRLRRPRQVDEEDFG